MGFPPGSIKTKQDMFALLKEKGSPLICYRVDKWSGFEKRIVKLHSKGRMFEVVDESGIHHTGSNQGWYGTEHGPSMYLFENYWFAYAYYQKVQQGKDNG